MTGERMSAKAAVEMLATLAADAVRGECLLRGLPIDDGLIDAAARMAAEHLVGWYRKQEGSDATTEREVAYALGRDEERAAVVAWLLRKQKGGDWLGRYVERGEHWVGRTCTSESADMHTAQRAPHTDRGSYAHVKLLADLRAENERLRGQVIERNDAALGLHAQGPHRG